MQYEDESHEYCPGCRRPTSAHLAPMSSPYAPSTIRKCTPTYTPKSAPRYGPKPTHDSEKGGVARDAGSEDWRRGWRGRPVKSAVVACNLQLVACKL